MTEIFRAIIWTMLIGGLVGTAIMMASVVFSYQYWGVGVTIGGFIMAVSLLFPEQIWRSIRSVSGAVRDVVLGSVRAVAFTFREIKRRSNVS